MPTSGGKYTPGNTYQPGQYKHVIAPDNIPLGGNRAQQLPPTLPPQGKPVVPLRGGAPYAIADPKNPQEAAPVPTVAAKAPRVVPAGSEKTWPGGGTGGLVDRLCAATKARLGITKSYKIK